MYKHVCQSVEVVLNMRNRLMLVRIVGLLLIRESKQSIGKLRFDEPVFWSVLAIKPALEVTKSDATNTGSRGLERQEVKDTKLIQNEPVRSCLVQWELSKDLFCSKTWLLPENLLQEPVLPHRLLHDSVSPLGWHSSSVKIMTTRDRLHRSAYLLGLQIAFFGFRLGWLRMCLSVCRDLSELKHLFFIFFDEFKLLARIIDLLIQRIGSQWLCSMARNLW